MRKLTFGMNLSLDGYIAAPGDDLGWSVPSDELFQWWSDRVGATGLALYGRKLWETMSSHWPTADQQPGATPAQIEFARRWRDMPKVVFSSTTSAVDWNARLVTGDAVTEITRLKTEDGGPMDVGGATLAAAAMRAGLIDEYAIVTHPVLVGGGTPFFTALDNWVNLNLVEIRRSRPCAPHQIRDQALNTRPRIGAGSGHPTRRRGRGRAQRIAATRRGYDFELQYDV
jgi:dihydrofolate reductase